MNDDKKLAAAKVKAFVDKYLDGDINQIAMFSLSKLWRDYEFGCLSSNRYDNDDTELMRCIYVLLFSDIWPGLTLEALQRYEYRGETMNTYNTMFGRPQFPYKLENMAPGLVRIGSIPPELLFKAANFRFKTYGRIGNMVVLPNRQLDCAQTENTINKYRGCHVVWHDYFDRFLEALRKALVNNEYDYNRFRELIELNAEYFQPFQSEDGFNSLVKGLFLTDYIGSDGLPEVLTKGYYFWQMDLTPDEYFAEAERYLDFAAAVIDRRSEKMLASLKCQFATL